MRAISALLTPPVSVGEPVALAVAVPFISDVLPDGARSAGAFKV
jgi:hypothetical protein